MQPAVLKFYPAIRAVVRTPGFPGKLQDAYEFVRTHGPERAVQLAEAGDWDAPAPESHWVTNLTHAVEAGLEPPQVWEIRREVARLRYKDRDLSPLVGNSGYRVSVLLEAYDAQAAELRRLRTLREPSARGVVTFVSPNRRVSELSADYDYSLNAVRQLVVNEVRAATAAAAAAAAAAPAPVLDPARDLVPAPVPDPAPNLIPASMWRRPVQPWTPVTDPALLQAFVHEARRRVAAEPDTWPSLVATLAAYDEGRRDQSILRRLQDTGTVLHFGLRDAYLARLAEVDAAVAHA